MPDAKDEPTMCGRAIGGGSCACFNGERCCCPCHAKDDHERGAGYEPLTEGALVDIERDIDWSENVDLADVRALVAEVRDHRARMPALIAAAYRECVQVCTDASDEHASWTEWHGNKPTDEGARRSAMAGEAAVLAQRIAAKIPASAREALDKMLGEAEARGRKAEHDQAVRAATALGNERIATIVSATNEAAALCAEAWLGDNDGEVGHEIRALTPADCQAALDTLLAAAKAEGAESEREACLLDVRMSRDCADAILRIRARKD